jgi:hypothetical protein
MSVLPTNMLRRLLSARFGPLWVGLFSVTVFSSFIYLGHRLNDSSAEQWSWRSAMTAVGSLGGKSGPSYDMLVHVPDPQGEAKNGVHHNYRWYSDSKLRELTACMARGNCPKNADKVRL